MERDSNYSSSDDTVEENTEDESLQQIKEIFEYEQLCEKMKRVKQALEINHYKCAVLESIISETKSQISPTKLGCHVSPIVSPIHKPPNLSEEPLKNLPHATISEGTLQLPEFIYDPKEAFLQAPKKESNVVSPQKASIYNETPDSPPVSPIHKHQDTSNAKIPKDFAESEETYAGKGKAAANPKFRYKKRRTPEVSPSQKTPIKPSEIASGAPGTKALDSPSPNADITRNSPSVKRKDVELDESSTTWISKLSGNRADDKENLKIAKKLKFNDDDEKASKQFPIIAALISQKCEPSDSSEYLAQIHNESKQLALPSDDEKASKQFPIIAGLISQKCGPSDSSEYVAQIHNESKQLVLPSSSGSTKIITYASSSEESSLTSGNEDVPCSEIGGSSLTSENDVPGSEKEESSLTSVSDLSDNAPN